MKRVSSLDLSTGSRNGIQSLLPQSFCHIGSRRYQSSGLIWLSSFIPRMEASAIQL